MLEKYLVINKKTNEKIGYLSVDIENDFYDYKPVAYLDESWKQVQFYHMWKVLGDYGNPEDIKDWVLNRAPDPYNEAIDLLLEQAHLDKYDAYGFFKYNEGMFIQDDFKCIMLEGKKVYTYSDMIAGR